MPATPPIASASAGPSASATVDITAILNSATITSSNTRRRIFHFERNDESPAPEAGPSSRPASLSIDDDRDSDLESLPELPKRGGPSTPTNSSVNVKVSSSQRKANGKGKERAFSVQAQGDSDSDIELVGFKELSPRANILTPQGEFPASQAILNSARRKSATPEQPFTPRKREGKRRARPSASHVQGRYALGETSAFASLSPSAGRKFNEAQPILEVEGRAESRRSESPSRTVASNTRATSYPSGHPVDPTQKYSGSGNGLSDMPGSNSESSMPPLTANASKATSTEQPAEPFILREIDQQSDSEIDELEGYASPPLPPSSLSIDNPAAQEPLLEMTMDDDVPLGMHLKPSSFLSVATQPWEESHKATLGITSPSSLPLTPPDVVITASDESLVSVPKEQNAITPRSRNELPIQPPIYSRFENDEAFGYVFNYFGGDSSRIEVSSDSEGDSDRMSPLRRRDVLIISENKSRRKPKISKDAKQRIMAELEPELLFSSADSGTSAGSDKRRPSPVNLLRPTKKNRARKIRDESQPLWYRHRDAIIWTGREIDGEFPYEELELIRKSCQDSHHMDNYNRARFESLVNDQLALEEPKAPRIRVKDPESDQTCPPFDFVYTNRVIYRDKVPRPTKAPGCNCVDGCRPDNPDCKCLKRQIKWTKTFPQGASFDAGFAYDAKGRLILPEEIPIVECNSNCACPADCMNRQVSNGRRYGLDLIKTAQKGWGVEAASDRPSIRKGSFLCIYSGELITWQEAERRGLENDDQANPTSYLFDIDASFIGRTLRGFEKDGFQIIGDVIGDATLPANSSPQAVESQTERYEMKQSLYTVDAMHFGNVGRFFNHACSPNGLLRSVFCDDADEFKPILAVFAKKKIYPGEEITISYRGGDVEGASEDHDSSTDEDGHGINGILTPRRVAATTFKNQRRKKRSWRMQNQGARSKSKGGKIKKAGGKAKQAGRLNPQAAPANFTVATQQCQCGAINCDGYMFQYSDASEGAADV